jgi:hypothetical protein
MTYTIYEYERREETSYRGSNLLYVISFSRQQKLRIVNTCRIVIVIWRCNIKYSRYICTILEVHSSRQAGRNIIAPLYFHDITSIESVEEYNNKTILEARSSNLSYIVL